MDFFISSVVRMAAETRTTTPAGGKSRVSLKEKVEGVVFGVLVVGTVAVVGILRCLFG